MSTEALAAKARKHWAEWLPEKTAALKAEGKFGEATMVAARQAEGEIRNLMAQGYQRHEAEEVILPQLILLKPEPGADELADEEAELEAEFQRTIAPLLRR
jgi:hypothetical protein